MLANSKYRYLTVLMLLSVSLSGHCDSLRVGLADWLPYSSHQVERRGIDRDLWTLLARELKVDLQITRCAWARCIAGLKNGELDVMNAMAKTPERVSFARYLQSHMKTHVSFYVRKGAANTIQNYRDLFDYRVGLVANSFYYEPFQSDENIEKHYVVKESQLFGMLNKKRLQVFIGTSPDVEYQLSISGNSDKFEKAAYDPQQTIPLYYAIARKSPWLKRFDEVDEALQRLLKRGRVTQLLKKYGQLSQ